MTGDKENVETKVPVPKEEFDKFKENYYSIMTGVIIVMLFAVISLLFSSYSLVQDSNNFKTAAYTELSGKIDQLNAKLK